MISVIVPVYNEAKHLHDHGKEFFERICRNNTQVIVVDGMSTDTTLSRLLLLQKKYPIHIVRSKKGRARQMNTGACHARGEILFFLFCDCLPSPDWDSVINRYLEQGYDGGFCRFHLYPGNRFSNILNHRYNVFHCHRRRFGDSGIITTLAFYQQLGGFDEKMIVEEDNKFIRSMRASGYCTIFPITVYVSDRIFVRNGYIQTYMLYLIVHSFYLCGASQRTLLYLVHCIKGTKN